MSDGFTRPNIGTEYEILKFIDTHLVIRVLDSYLLNSQSEVLLDYKKKLLFKTSLFDLQEKITTEMTELEDLNKKKEEIFKHEEEIRSSINGFLNLIGNLRKNGNIDTSASIHKKIVKY